MSKHQLKLSRKMSLGIILLATPLFIASVGILYIQSRYLIHQEALKGGSSLLNATLYRVHSYMSTLETAANSNAWMMEEHLQPDSLKSVSNRIVRLNDPVVSSSVYMIPDLFKEYGHGFSIYTVQHGDSVTSYIEPEYNYFHKACYTEPVKTGKTCWVDPFVEYTEGEVDHHVAIATYCRPLKRKNGRIVGVLTTEMSLSKLSDMINKQEHPYPTAYFMLLGADGRYLIHPDTTLLFRKTIFTDADPSQNSDMITLGHEMIAGKRGSMHVHINGELLHVIYRPVPDTDWSLAVVCPDSDAMKSFYELGYVIIIIMIIGLLLIVWFSSQMVKQTISPLNSLLESTQQFAVGNFDKLVPTTRQQGVIGQLQNSFAKMQISLSTRMGSLRAKADEIREHNKELEQVQKQTDDMVRRKNQFIQNVAQHMRMPLNVILGFADVLRESSSNKTAMSEEELTNISTMMKNNAVSMNRMVLMLFDASETSSNEVMLSNRQEEISVNDMAQLCIKYTYSHFPHAKIHLDTKLPDTVHIVSNRMYLMRTLGELLYNAAKYTDGQHIDIIISQTATTIRYTIQDIGPGLPEGSMNQIFKPFTKVDNLAEGLGLGLPLAKRHALSLGGDLIFDTDYHAGCRVILELPK